MAKDAKGHGSEGRGAEPAAHQIGIASLPDKSYLAGKNDNSAAAFAAFWAAHPLVPPSSAPHGGLPDARLASWKRTVSTPGL